MNNNIIKTPWFGLAKFFLFVIAAPCSILGVIYLLRPEKSPAWMINGVIWALVAIICFVKASLEKRKLNNLKESGVRYNGTITNILPSNAIRIGSYVTARIQFIVDTQTDKFSFISGYYLLTTFDQKDKLLVSVYIDPNKLKRYAIELSRIEN